MWEGGEDLKPGNEFWNRVRVPGSYYKSLPQTHSWIKGCGRGPRGRIWDMRERTGDRVKEGG